MPEFCQNLMVSIVVAIVSAVVTVFLAFRRFRRERWWDRKADAYAAIIEALHHMKRGIEDDIRVFQQYPPKQEDEASKERTKKYRQAYEEVHKAVNTGSFLLSKEAVDTLDRFMSDFQKARDDARMHDGYLDPDTHLSGMLNAIKKCLDSLPPIAKRDLGVR
jgi:hypothetical protein